LVNPVGALPAGLIIAAGSYVSAADTITVQFANLTGSTISYTGSVHPVVIRQYY
jgi:ABC-type molybdate transport system substrate-binding protein